MARFCPYCGKQLSERSKFCPQCGKNTPNRRRSSPALNEAEATAPGFGPRQGGIPAPRLDATLADHQSGLSAPSAPASAQPQSGVSARSAPAAVSQRRFAPATHAFIDTFQQAGFGLRYGAWMFDFLITLIAMMSFTFIITAVSKRSVVVENSDVLKV